MDKSLHGICPQDYGTMTVKDHPIPDLTNHSLYTELRLQENSRQTLQLMNGDVTSNSVETVSGVSARVCDQGQWGFASLPEINDHSIRQVLQEAGNNAAFLAGQQGSQSARLPDDSFSVSKDFSSQQPAATQEQKLAFLKAIDRYVQDNCPSLESRIIRLHLETISKRVHTSTGSQGFTRIPRTILTVCLVASNDQQEPVELLHIVSDRGEYQDVLTEPSSLYADIDKLYQQLLDKKEAVPASAGYKEVILDSELSGLLAHEAVGHPVEADLVLAGSVAAELQGEMVASPIVSMVDFAHSCNGETLPVPVFIDDEGSKAEDAVLIDQGRLTGFMHNRYSAAQLEQPSSGNARAFKYFDEPLIRMRNTAILPGHDKLEAMIASIDDGYYLIKSNNGEADATAEFMFGITLGYEIKNGKLGRAIQDTTISGMAFDVLKTVTMVSDDLHWECSGYCGKKQDIPVACGGPAIKCKVHIGGE
ncbi:TldD/PmbA family protein [Endozoicomonas lisbonensis]|uniref:TldD protein n=1 Tax=Endozoicomonas lisbonensis TaxID=3120522 RepID=A0ABV2SCL5_9GAMM